MSVLALLQLLEISEHNGNYQRLVIAKIEGLAAIKSCEVADLTLREIISCIEAANDEYTNNPNFWAAFSGDDYFDDLDITHLFDQGEPA